MKEQISGALDSLVADVDDLKERTKAIEEATVNMTMKNDEHRAAIDALENRMEEMKQRLDDKINKLESFSKRDNLKFFNVAENYDSCAKKILDLLQNCVPDRVWQLSDIVRAHRRGTDKNRNDSGSNTGGNGRRPRPIIVKFAHWGAKMHVLTKGRDGLKRQGVAVAGDPTTRQQSVIKQYRNDGINQDLRTGVTTTLDVEVAGATGVGPRRPQATAMWHRGVLLVGIVLTSLLRLLVESQTQLQME